MLFHEDACGLLRELGSEIDRDRRRSVEIGTCSSAHTVSIPLPRVAAPSVGSAVRLSTTHSCTCKYTGGGLGEYDIRSLRVELLIPAMSESLGTWLGSRLELE